MHTCPPQHKHYKTATCYSAHGCRCESCKNGRHYRYKKHEMDKRLHPKGKKTYVNAEPSVDRLRYLLNIGYNIFALSAMTGLSQYWLYTLNRADGPRTVEKVKADILARFVPDPSVLNKSKNKVPAFSTRRRLEDLVLKGWWPCEISRVAGISHSTTMRILRGGSSISAATHAAIKEAHKVMFGRVPDFAMLDRNRKGAFTNAKRLAERESFGSIIHWDDVERAPDYSCPPGHAHYSTGTTTCYENHKCRCDPCRRGNTVKAADLRRKRAESYGSVERLTGGV